MGGYMPAHYLKQFHPKFASKEEMDKAIADTGVRQLGQDVQVQERLVLEP